MIVNADLVASPWGYEEPRRESRRGIQGWSPVAPYRES